MKTWTQIFYNGNQGSSLIVEVLGFQWTQGNGMILFLMSYLGYSQSQSLPPSDDKEEIMLSEELFLHTCKLPL